jgi:O-succinylbenzoic acid--CoA ligase
MKWSIQINGKHYNNKNLSSVDDSEIRDFLEKWGNNELYISVKTSGSTGKPKLIDLLKSDMIASAKLTGKYFNLENAKTALLCLPVKYIAGKMMLVRAMVLGFDLISVKPSSNPIIDCIKSINFAAMTPMQVNTVLNQSPDKLNLIEQLIIGGAPVDSILESKLQNLKAHCFSTYGMTESITHIAVKKLNGENQSKYFEALPNITFQPNKDDCLVIKTPHLSTSTITTSDIIKIIDKQTFKWIGRIDNVVNSAGIKIHPEELETKISHLLNNTRFFFSSLPDELLGERLVLVIESKNSISDLDSGLKKLLDTFEMPKTIFYTDSFLETKTKKIDRIKTLQNVLN